MGKEEADLDVHRSLLGWIPAVHGLRRNRGGPAGASYRWGMWPSDGQNTKTPMLMRLCATAEPRIEPVRS